MLIKILIIPLVVYLAKQGMSVWKCFLIGFSILIILILVDIFFIEL